MKAQGAITPVMSGLFIKYKDVTNGSNIGFVSTSSVTAAFKAMKPFSFANRKTPGKYHETMQEIITKETIENSDIMDQIQQILDGPSGSAKSSPGKRGRNR